MIIHSQIFETKSKRSLADFTIQVSLQTSSKISYDDLGSKCEDLYSKLTEFDLTSTASVLERSNDNFVCYYG